MYVQIDSIDDPANGEVQIIDGAFGTGSSAASLRVHQAGGGLVWQAYDFSAGDWLNVGIDFDLASPYRVVLDVNPLTFTYAATVQLVNTAGDVQETATFSELAFNPNVITNEQHGSLLFYVQAAGPGGAQVSVDNISITAVPEPAFAGVILVVGLLALVARRKKLSLPYASLCERRETSRINQPLFRRRPSEKRTDIETSAAFPSP